MNCKKWALCLVAAVAIGMTTQTTMGAEKKDKSDTKKETSSASSQLVTEGEFSKWLIKVLGLSRFVSVAPSEQECFAALLQNGITPKNGWNGTNIVTRATLARVVVQSLGLQNEVKNPQNDASWIDYLKEKGMDISTIGAAVENLELLDSPLANQAVVVSTDPLGKIDEIRPEDEQQLGADLSTIRRLLLFIEEEGPGVPPTPAPRRDRPDRDEPPVTPNFPS